MQGKNILILGETGVGKSTWINGIVNYLSFADLNEARQADDFPVLIPSQFAFTKQGKYVDIKIGEVSDNEVLQTGQSATQETRSYIFHVGDQKIRLIDTPGIGDSRGLEQDRKNFDNILSYLSYYEEIHAVCILLKPNNSRLTAMFRFCIQELLARLHISAKKNIVFCFTNARVTFYQPGETLPALNKMLEDKQIGITANPNNYFCFDNETFRFLACLHNNVDFDDEDIRTYAASWDRAANETNKLFGHINKIPPHKIRNTISINEARRVILAMSKPIAEVAKMIQLNKQAAKYTKEQIDVHDMKLDELQEEETAILQVSARYGAFLKDNAIIPYNDAVGDYLDMAIRHEENKAEILRNNDLLQQLRKRRTEYDKEKLILDEAMKSGTSTTREQIIQLQQQLFDLKHFGKILKDIFERISIYQSSQNMRFSETVVFTTHQWQRTSNSARRK